MGIHGTPPRKVLVLALQNAKMYTYVYIYMCFFGGVAYMVHICIPAYVHIYIHTYTYICIHVHVQEHTNQPTSPEAPILRLKAPTPKSEPEAPGTPGMKGISLCPQAGHQHGSPHPGIPKRPRARMQRIFPEPLPRSIRMNLLRLRLWYVETADSS